MLKTFISNSRRRIKKYKKKLIAEFKNNKEIRSLRKEAINIRNIVSVFDSVLTRTLGLKQNQLYDDIMIVQTYYFEIIEDIIINGFNYNGEHYIPFTASAGQIRTKKTVFIKESSWKEHEMTLTCGLTVDKINEFGGCNINKYLAYLALSNSATDEWTNFDINKAIVVDDMETTVRGLVDYIDHKTYQITRKEVDILINHTDGAGLYLPKVNSKNMMIRLPWIKGLLISFPFDKFIQQANSEGKNYGKIKDIYGQEWDILKDNIEVIFTKSQFKMWKYYSSWNDYKEKYKKYSCQAGQTNEEEDFFNNAKIGYQMLQSLSDMTDEEIKTVIKTTKYNITNIGSDKKTMLKLLGVTKGNINKNYLQQALEIYPELLRDTYCREILKEVKKSIVKEAKGGKVEVVGKYTFISPDMYAFCEYLFLQNKNPEGLLKNGEVFCSLYDNNQKLDCLRSPSLYREHPIRINTRDKEKEKWFTTNALYTSCHDLISKILMFDVDGDKSLVCADKTIVSVAERNMKDIVPLYYEMAKADPSTINRVNIFQGLKTAYTGGNIGVISNNITKIWNSKSINLDVIKLLCLENNFTIDYAKTLFKPQRPKEMNKLITEYTKLKVPYFFQFAKDKNEKNVEKINGSLVNRLSKMIPNPIINFTHAGLDEFDYKILMSNPNVEIDNNIVKTYIDLDLKKHFMLSKDADDEQSTNMQYLYLHIKEKLLEINSDISYITDVLIKYLYEFKNSNYKTTLWECFGDIIIENLKENIKSKHKYCEKCGIPIKVTSNRTMYCENCAKEIDRNKAKERMRNIRKQ